LKRKWKLSGHRKIAGATSIDEEILTGRKIVGGEIYPFLSERSASTYLRIIVQKQILMNFVQSIFQEKTV
jgi:hypothetical protein